MRKWLIKMLYESLDDWAKYEVFDIIKRPTIEHVIMEQARQAERIFGK